MNLGLIIVTFSTSTFWQYVGCMVQNGELNRVIPEIVKLSQFINSTDLGL